MLNITISKDQTKQWRQTQDWWKGGRKNECELYQRGLIERITGNTCHKTNERLHTNNYQLACKSQPLKCDDGMEWTEDFDGKMSVDDQTYYFNFKMICSSGGAQTRSLREVYHFVEAQQANLLAFPDANRFFINILDGDECFRSMRFFKYLLKNKPTKHIFVGDLHTFQTWWSNR